MMRITHIMLKLHNPCTVEDLTEETRDMQESEINTVCLLVCYFASMSAPDMMEVACSCVVITSHDRFNINSVLATTQTLALQLVFRHWSTALSGDDALLKFILFIYLLFISFDQYNIQHDKGLL